MQLKRIRLARLAAVVAEQVDVIMALGEGAKLYRWLSVAILDI